MPTASRASSPIRRWVVVAGWVIRDLESPRLLEMSTTCRAFISAKAASLPPSTSKVTTVPPPYICVLASSCCGCDSSHG